MAVLQLENGTVYTEFADISRELAPLGIGLNTWALGDSPELRNLLQKAALTDEEKEQVLETLDHYFEQLQRTAGYQSRDLIVIHPEIPNLDGMLSKFDKIHTHADDEVRYVIDGEGVFGFVRPDGTQVRLTVEAEEYINVPAGTEHWFYLTNTKRIKAVRYFTSTEGWTPEYTGREIRVPASIAS
jgi:1,2-dihydroxy-3-keto-5-methylthiopentene dioxygenase